MANDTTAKIERLNYILQHASTAPEYRDLRRENGGITLLYPLNSQTRTLYPAGIIPTSDEVINYAEASIFVYDEAKEPFNYVNLTTQRGGFNRWAQDESKTMTEFSQSWTLSKPYCYIKFSVDVRYLDRAYMYDKVSGQVWFAGKNTPYYGKKHI